jgi:hypothetical protein
MLNSPQPERERDGEAGEDQRRRRQQRLRQVVRRVRVRARVPPEPDVVVRERDVDVVVAEVEEPVQAGALEHRLVDAARVMAGRGDDDAAHQEREHRGEERRDDPAGTLVEREPFRDRRRVALGIALE